MKDVAIISDTHMPSRAPRIPDWVQEKIKKADHVIHAGDFDSPEAYQDVLEILESDMTAVRGNMDPYSLDVPDVARVEIEEIEFVVTHGTGPPNNYEQRVAKTVRKNATKPQDRVVGVSGHTHETMDKKIGGYRIINPGSATGAAPAKLVSMQTAKIDGSKIEVTTHTK